MFQNVFLFGAAATLFAVSANAQNLVSNPSFASGFTGWTTHACTVCFSGGWYTAGVPSDPGTPPPATSTSAEDACYGLGCNDPVAGDWISQTLTTVAGQTYVLSFYYDAGVASGVGSGTTELEAIWNGTPVTGGTIVNGTASTWVKYTFTVVATGTSTVLEFTGRDDETGNDLTNISVTAQGPPPTPAPPTMVLSLAGLAAVALYSLRGKLLLRRS